MGEWEVDMYLECGGRRSSGHLIEGSGARVIVDLHLLLVLVV